MNIKIGDRVNLRNPFSNEFGEYELVSIHESGDYIFKGEGLTTQVITEQCLRYLGINKKVKYMNFIEAVKLLQLDKTIKLMRRSGYSSITIDIDGVFRTNYWANYKPSIDDILAEDWYVVKDEKLHTFNEALTYFKDGKYIRRKIHNDYLRFHKDGYCEFGAIDVMANDWIILDEEKTK